MAVNGTVPYGNLNVPFNVYDSAVKAGHKYAIDPAILLSIGHFESGYRTDARNENPPLEASYGWLQFNRLAGNGSRQADPNFDIAALFDPYHSADLAASKIRGSLDKGVPLYDALSPWSVRDKALALYATNGQITGTVPAAAGSPSPSPSPAASGGAASPTGAPISTAFTFPKLPFGPVTIDSSPLFKVALSAGAVVILFVGIVKLTSIDSAIKKVV